MKIFLIVPQLLILLFVHCKTNENNKKDNNNLVLDSVFIAPELGKVNNELYQDMLKSNKLNKDIYSKYTHNLLSSILAIKWTIYKYKNCKFQDYVGQSNSLQDSIIYRVYKDGSNCQLIYNQDTFLFNKAINYLTKDTVASCLAVVPDLYLIKYVDKKYLVCKGRVMGAAGPAINKEIFIVYYYQTKQFITLDSDGFDYACYSICNYNNDEYLDFIRVENEYDIQKGTIDLNINIYSLNPKKIELLKHDMIENYK